MTTPFEIGVAVTAMRTRLGLGLFGLVMLLVGLGQPAAGVHAAQHLTPADFVGVAATGDPTPLLVIGRWPGQSRDQRPRAARTALMADPSLV